LEVRPLDEEVDEPEEKSTWKHTDRLEIQLSRFKWLVKTVVGTWNGADACFARVSSNWNFLNNGTAIKEKKSQERGR